MPNFTLKETAMEIQSKYKMNRSVLSGKSFEEANDHVTYWNNKTPFERLEAACFIINNIFGVTPQTRINWAVISKRKRK